MSAEITAHEAMLSRVDGLGQIYAVERFLESLISAVRDEWKEFHERPIDGIIENLTVPYVLTILRQNSLRFAWDGTPGECGEGSYFQKRYGRSDLEIHLPDLRDECGGCMTDRLLHMWAEEFGEGLLEQTQDDAKPGCGVFTDDTKTHLAYSNLIILPDPENKVLDEALSFYEQQKNYSPDEDDDDLLGEDEST